MFEKMKKTKLLLIPILLTIFIANTVGCSQAKEKKQTTESIEHILPDTIKPAALRPDKYLPILAGKRVGLIANQTALVGDEHLVDFLLKENIEVVKIFSPEHGFRGNVERGKHFKSTVDKKTGLPIVAIFGKNRKPQKKDLKDIDILVFDIQDVGVRFFTYISSMHMAMEAAAENHIDFLVLDRPNPLGDYIAGPVLNLKYQSFVGMHPIPIVHGLTVGELAMMINGEKWLKGGITCNLQVVKCKNYDHTKSWTLKIKPSPNLPTDLSIRLYPSLCFFEATKVSIGRGTEFPFQAVGYPDSLLGNFSFVPKDIEGMQTNPVQEGEKCYGIDLRNSKPDSKFTLKYFLSFYKVLDKQGISMISNPRWFNLLVGNNRLIDKIQKGMSEEEIYKSWEKEIDDYKIIRKKYLLYTDF